MAGKKIDLGPMGEVVRENLRRIREEQRLTYAELSRILEHLDRPIPPLGLRRIEGGDRRVDVDDLVALAQALVVSPISLLMPATAKPDDGAVITSDGETNPAYAVWAWLIGEALLDHRSGQDQTPSLTFQRKTRPRWLPLTGVGELTPAGEADMAVLDDIARRAAHEAVRRALHAAQDRGDDGED